MYLAHFGIREQPFGITPDTSFFYPSSSYQEALNTLLLAVKNGEGFIKVVGEVGAGKTMLCRKFMASLDNNFVSAYIPNPYLEPYALLLALAEELGLSDTMAQDHHLLLKSLNIALLDFARQGKSVVVCLDEAQAMPMESLEALRLLSNLETEKRKLLQVILFGQPELDKKLSQPRVRQIKQRITFQHRLNFLRKDEIEHYLNHRLAVAGYRGGALFSDGAIKRLYWASGGAPRLVNILAHKAMMLAYGEGKLQIQNKHIKAAAQDTPAVRDRLFKVWWLWLLLPLLGIGLAWSAHLMNGSL